MAFSPVPFTTTTPVFQTTLGSKGVEVSVARGDHSHPAVAAATLIAWASAITVNVGQAGDFVITNQMTAATTLTFTNAFDGCSGSLIIQQDGTGGWGLTVAAIAGYLAIIEAPSLGPYATTRYNYLFQAGFLLLKATHRISPTLLDIGLPARAAWTVNERLRADYTGAICRVRRASDGTETDIGTATSSIYVDQAAIATFCGASVGTVSKVYDQSGYGYDMVQATVAAQPQLYNGTTCNTEGGNVVVATTGVEYMQTPSSLGLSGVPVCSMASLYRTAIATASDIALLTIGPSTLNAISFYVKNGSGVGVHGLQGGSVLGAGYLTGQSLALRRWLAVVPAITNSMSAATHIRFPTGSGGGGTAAGTPTLVANGSPTTLFADATLVTKLVCTWSTTVVFAASLTSADQTVVNNWLEARRTA